MNFVTVAILTFIILGLCALAAVAWTFWFPTTRCQKIRINSDSEYNVCIRHKSHDGSHMMADGKRFR